MRKQILKIISYLMLSVAIIILESFLIAMMGTIIINNFTYWIGVLTAIVVLNLIVFNFTVVKHTYKCICNSIVSIKVIKDSKNSKYAKVYNPYNHLEKVLNDKGILLLEKYLNLDSVHKISDCTFNIKHDINSGFVDNRRNGILYRGEEAKDTLMIELNFVYKMNVYKMSWEIQNYKTESSYIVVQKNGEIGNSSSLFTLEFYSRLLQVVSDILGSSITFLITSRKSKTIKVNNSIKIYNNYIKEYLGAN